MDVFPDNDDKRLEKMINFQPHLQVFWDGRPIFPFSSMSRDDFLHSGSSIGSDGSLPICFLGEVDPDAPQANASGSFQVHIGWDKTRQKTFCLIQGLNEAKAHQKVVLVIQPNKESLQMLSRSVVDSDLMGPREARPSQIDAVETNSREVFLETPPPVATPILGGPPLNPG